MFFRWQNSEADSILWRAYEYWTTVYECNSDCIHSHLLSLQVFVIFHKVIETLLFSAISVFNWSVNGNELITSLFVYLFSFHPLTTGDIYLTLFFCEVRNNYLMHIDAIHLLFVRYNINCQNVCEVYSFF